MKEEYARLRPLSYNGKSNANAMLQRFFVELATDIVCTAPDADVFMVCFSVECRDSFDNIISQVEQLLVSLFAL